MTQRASSRSRRDREPEEPLTAREAVALVRDYMTEMTEGEPVRMTSATPTEEGGWIIEVEMVEDRRIPSSARHSRRYTRWSSTPAEKCWRINGLVATCAGRLRAGAARSDTQSQRRLLADAAGGRLVGSGGQSTNLADILERVLDTGIVIAGDIRVNLLDIELLDDQAPVGHRVSGNGQGSRNRLVGERSLAQWQEFETATRERAATRADRGARGGRRPSDAQ